MVTSLTNVLFSFVLFTPEASFHAKRLALIHAKRFVTSHVGFRLASSSLVLLSVEEQIISSVFKRE
jgi:hypothetical protein